jgi:hypothetical protein
MYDWTMSFLCENATLYTHKTGKYIGKNFSTILCFIFTAPFPAEI